MSSTAKRWQRSVRAAVRRAVPFSVRRAMRRKEPRVLVLAYHRVADVECDPWAMCVSPEQFREQMSVLRSLELPVTPVSALPQAIEHAERGHRAVAVTFDDGYADALYAAAPILTKYEVPATVFVVTGAVGGEREFWWDDLERLVLAPEELPENFDLHVDGTRWQRRLGRSARMPSDDPRRKSTWRAWQSPPSERHALYYDLWKHLYEKPPAEKRQLLDALADLVGVSAAVRKTHSILSVEEMRRLTQSGTIEVGAHTVGHPALSERPAEEQMREIQQSKMQLEAWQGRAVQSFCYPHGDYDDRTRVLVRQAGFRNACTLDGGAVERRTDPFKLPRMEVGPWDGDAFADRVRQVLRMEANS